MNYKTFNSFLIFGLSLGVITHLGFYILNTRVCKPCNNIICSNKNESFYLKLNDVSLKNKKLNELEINGFYDDSDARNYRCSSKDVNIQLFKDVAFSILPVTDKVNHHKYETMYGIFLSSFKSFPIKFLEIGLGCNMEYGPGASVQVWKKYLHSKSEIWMAEFDQNCVEKHIKNNNIMQSINVLIGDQGDFPTLEHWVEKSGGNFDIIIDDGGHHNKQLKNSFDILWPTLKPGGLYFMEDLHTAFLTDMYGELENGKTMADVIHQWNSALMIENVKPSIAASKPIDLHFVFCQLGACVFGKSP